ncbi:hypothetical protein P3T76_013848 [Phytophthora citrophthora]|uniref:PDZ domain-containing protein n=1 Tax=Phytophthora citrophthora TaxID=4793 RepID=A0AAD9G1V1_9STRA|nr:hypothetical protein P3T76_013848 [Phytophthora citrophthora]
MEFQDTLDRLGSIRNVVKKVDVWSPRKPSIVACATGKNSNERECKNQSSQRLASTASSAETITSKEDYEAETDTKEDAGGDDSTTEDDIMMTCPRGGIMRNVNEIDRNTPEDCYQYEILLWFGSSIGGVGFRFCENTGYPYVQNTDGNESLPGMWNIQEGDFLVAMNERSTHISAVAYESVMRIVATGARPAVLRFRRPTSQELQLIPSQNGKPPNEERLGRRRNRERLEKTLSYVIWREGDGPLGVSLKKQSDSLYPVVADMNRTSIIRHHANIGDQLISINQHDIYKLGSKRWVQLLKSAPKPLVLTFRRMGPPPNDKGVRTLDL